MTPARQAFETDDLLVAHTHLGLVVQFDAAVGQALAQVLHIELRQFGAWPRTALAPVAAEQDLDQQFRIDRFLQSTEEAEAMLGGQPLGGLEDAAGSAGKQNDFALVAPPRDMAQELDAVHAWHRQIADQDVRLRGDGFEQYQAILTARRGQDVAGTELVKYLRQICAHRDIVVQQQDVKWPQRHGNRLVLISSAAGVDRWQRSLRCDRPVARSSR